MTYISNRLLFSLPAHFALVANPTTFGDVVATMNCNKSIDPRRMLLCRAGKS